MAEATVENPHLSSMFFCHECQREMQPNIPAYTCSRCNSGFIEELDNRPASTQSATNNASSSNNPPSTMTDPAAQFAEMFSLWRTHRYNTRQNAHAAASMEQSNADDSEDEMLGRSVAPFDLAINLGNDGSQPQTLHGIINYVMGRLTSDLGGGRPVHLMPGSVQLHANPGDYAWGTGGLDVIISQLLNQLEGTGAPPAQRETIASLPKVQINQSQVESQLQCSICMDDFELDQEVHKLPCDHYYHSECIVRWLEMHGTCPVCRKDLNGEDTSRNEPDFSNIYPSGPLNLPSASSSDSSMGPSTTSSSSMDFD